MPSKTPAQARLMAACAHGANYSSCPPKKVATEFNQADKGTGILKRDMGGSVPIPGSMPGGMGSVPTHMHGLIPGTSGGRADALHMKVAKGAYVMPADVVSGIGEGNTMAGARALDHSFPAHVGNIQGRAHPRGFAPLMNHPFKPGFPVGKVGNRIQFHADGGKTKDTDDEELTDVMLSPGEYVIHPRAIKAKYGDLKYGWKVLDHYVQHRREQHIKDLKKLKPPVGAKPMKKAAGKKK